MFVFEHPVTIKPTDIDEMNHVNNVVYLRYVQEIAELHWKTHAPTSLQQEVAWVVVRHEIDYLSEIKPHDIILARTWLAEKKGATSFRHVELLNTQTKKIVAKAVTTWCMLDRQTLRPKRIEDQIEFYLKSAKQSD
ncbi:MAG: acyl-CoA thioesterase [Cyclobacteriaceae bacterium]|jgi:acyl-CoA thioester hydrolase|nr:acyl-CoA thioesterase [Cyclobacteriaceae bacterium]